MFNKDIKLETKNLLIRPFVKEDSVAIYEIMKDKEMYTYTPDKPWESIDDSVEFLNLVFWLYDLNHNTFRHFFVVTEKYSCKVIGLCGIGGVEYDREQNEVFYSIGKSNWGKGYATEAGEAMLKYAFCDLGLIRVIGVVHQNNIASNKIMEKLGLKKIGVLSGLPEEHSFFNGEFLYSLSKEEYKLCN